MGTSDESPLESRPPTLEDLLELCRQLNAKDVSYVVVGGMAVIQHGFVRATEDIDLLLDSSPENEKKLKEALLYLPDQAIKEVALGDLEKYVVIRLADEIVIDLMKSACGVDYEEAKKDIVVVEIEGVPIPFAKLELLKKLKQGVREKDKLDLIFIQGQLDKSKIQKET